MWRSSCWTRLIRIIEVPLSRILFSATFWNPIETSCKATTADNPARVESWIICLHWGGVRNGVGSAVNINQNRTLGAECLWSIGASLCCCSKWWGGGRRTTAPRGRDWWVQKGVRQRWRECVSEAHCALKESASEPSNTRTSNHIGPSRSIGTPLISQVVVYNTFVMLSVVPHYHRIIYNHILCLVLFILLNGIVVLNVWHKVDFQMNTDWRVIWFNVGNIGLVDCFLSSIWLLAVFVVQNLFILWVTKLLCSYNLRWICILTLFITLLNKTK